MSTESALVQTPKWVMVVEAIALLLFGLAAIAWPGMTFYAFTVAFGIYALVAGIVKVISGIVTIGRGWKSIATILIGVLLAGAGSYVLNHPGVTALTLVVIIGFSFLARGIVDIVVAADSSTDNRALSVVAGVLGILAGLIVLRYPVGSGLAYVWIVGIYALIAGTVGIAQALSAED